MVIFHCLFFDSGARGCRTARKRRQWKITQANSVYIYLHILYSVQCIGLTQ
jgi:hypothetical protein